ncbi:hypothetical protein ASPWEDRAFT_175772 [Aspergillus wentii DTO 134E9]|uniref:PEBP-like protein n=1 Tax=Aspergillus wentii DTO 134E9 TaxID=1073089 RepID=A0A1L9RC47_ASPWE|nr:uncharacterized protein ASPWEDRAFT_175772 [Aspergillus wentii DTO 134E9]KAI9935052.1 hypothetical protein MW887_000673 [Aspergillus wentii]OJJ32491.1 hypothetical protein ASPWEDRAFT_175772 [Aspergillus wentii DTO 134E9]
MNILILVFTLISLVQSIPFLPPHNKKLHLRYPNGSWISPGDDLLMPETAPLPQISIIGLDCHKTYLVLFIDLDALLQPIATITPVLHWYQPDLIPNCVDHPHLLTNTSTSGASYIPPQPPPHSHHRYTYLLYEQPQSYTFPECFGYIFPTTPEGRGGFNVRQFMDVAGLNGPVAANYFFVINQGGVTASVTATTTSIRSAPCGRATGKWEL